MQKILTCIILCSFFGQSLVLAEELSTTTIQTSFSGPVITATSTPQVTEKKAEVVPVKTKVVQSQVMISCVIPKQASLLQKGSKDGASKSVTKLQNFLHAAGYLAANPNGYFGAGTHGAVKAFQKDYGYTVTGIVGPYTLAKINELNCGAENVLDTSSTIVVKKAVPAPVAAKKIVAKEIDTVSQEIVAVEQVTNSLTKPVISSFSINPTSAGNHLYSAKVTNVDTLSLKALCPPDVTEIRALVGLTKQKIGAADTFCGKEKYLFLSDQGVVPSFERRDSPLVFTDREGIPSWLAFDASTTPATDIVNYVVTACLKAKCVQKNLSLRVSDFYQKVASKDLSISDVRVDEKQNLFFSAYNVNNVTVKAGCPYNVQAMSETGVALDDLATPCNVEKSVLASVNEIVPVFEKVEGIPLSTLGLFFAMKNVNGQVDPYANVEINVKACSGISSISFASSTLRCVERAAYFPVYAKK